MKTSVKLATKVSCSSTFAIFSFLKRVRRLWKCWNIEQNGEGAGQSLGPFLWLNLFCNHHVIFSHLKAYFFSYLLRCCMGTYNAWFPRSALGNRLMFFCRVFSPAVGRGSSALSTFLDRRTQRVKGGLF